MKAYQYKHHDGRIIDLSELLSLRSKSYVAAKAARLNREHALIAAIEAFRHAGELDLARQILSSPRYAELFEKAVQS